MITCKLTGDVAPGAKAHLIPRSFYPIEGDALNPMRMIHAGEFPMAKRIPIGVYDPEIVTAKGEARFQSVDDYAARLFLQKEILLTEVSSAPSYREFTSIDYNLTKLFFLSVLWRLAVSRHQFATLVDIGAHEERLRRHILEEDPGGVEDFGVIIGWHQRTPISGNAMLGPRMKTLTPILGGKPFTICEIFMCRITAYIKLDPGPVSPLWTDYSLAPGNRLKVAILDQITADPAYTQMSFAVKDLVDQGRLKVPPGE